MRTRNEYLHELRKVAPYIKEKYGVVSMRLFGSVAREENRPDSDLDVFVEMPPKALNLFALQVYLQELLGVSVDVVRNHSRLDPFFLNEISRDGITVFR